MTRLHLLAASCAIAALTWQGLPAQAQTAGGAPAAATSTYTPTVGQAGKDVVWVPTHQSLVDRMLDMAEVTKEDYLIDLGAGDGRTVITAAKRGLRAHGIEYNPDMVALARRNAQAEGVADRATFAEADIFQSDFSQATVITLFLLPTLNERLRPILLEMKPGTRIVSNSFRMGDWIPDQELESGNPACTSFCRAFKWVIPAKVGGEWSLGQGRLSLTQTYQMLSGTLTEDGKSLPISEAKMDGSTIRFVAGGRSYSGQVNGNSISGTIQGGGNWTASRS